MDLTDTDLCSNPDGLADITPSSGGERIKWVPGRYKGIIEKCTEASNETATKLTPCTDLKVFEVIESENPNAKIDFAGKNYRAYDSLSGTNENMRKVHQASLLNLIRIAGKLDKWKKFVAAIISIEDKITSAKLCNWINEHCVGTVVEFTLKPQYSHDKKKAEAAAKGEPFKPFWDHEFIVPATAEAPARVNEAPASAPKAAPASPSADPFS